jgi:predicted Fe-Mo cluster-binding NifX family protein
MLLGVVWSMVRLKIAVPTKAYAGLEDVISDVFGKTKTFTIVEVENGQIRNVRVIDNPATSYEYGSGPVVVKMLADLKINYVLATELGPGVSGLLEHHHIRKVLVKPNTKVSDAVKEVLIKLEV